MVVVHKMADLLCLLIMTKIYVGFLRILVWFSQQSILDVINNRKYMLKIRMLCLRRLLLCHAASLYARRLAVMMGVLAANN